MKLPLRILGFHRANFFTGLPFFVSGCLSNRQARSGAKPPRHQREAEPEEENRRAERRAAPVCGPAGTADFCSGRVIVLP